MDKNELQIILQSLYDQKLSPNEVIKQLATLPYENLDFAKIDHHRSLRNGSSEVIFSDGKTDSQLLAIIKSLHKAGHDILATKCSSELYKKIKPKLPPKAVYNSISSTLIIQKVKKRKRIGQIIIVSHESKIESFVDNIIRINKAEHISQIVG